jgi:hypothetical protein
MVQEVLPPAESQPWFEFNGLPLKWCVSRRSTDASSKSCNPGSRTTDGATRSTHRGIPTGVLYDMFVGGGMLPWELTVRTSLSISANLRPQRTIS